MIVTGTQQSIPTIVSLAPAAASLMAVALLAAVALTSDHRGTGAATPVLGLVESDNGCRMVPRP